VASIAVGNAIKNDFAADVILANVEFISDRSLDDDREDAPKRRRPERPNRKRISI
jgi:hypothetical protein